MGCDLVVALGSATVQQQTLLALNLHGPLPQGQALVRVAAKHHAPDETVRTQFLEIPQARETYAALGQQPAGTWGFAHGLNEHGLAIGHSQWESQVSSNGPGLLGTDLVRLLLQRCKNARCALEQLSELLTRHGQGRLPQGDGDNVFLLADSREAVVVETAGAHWALVDVQSVRAVSDLGIIRQDWQKLSPGLAEHAIQKGLWPDDGSKLDFAGTFGSPLRQQAAAARRLGRASRLLEQQNGHLDPQCLRRLLEEHFQDIGRGEHASYLGSFISQTSLVPTPLAWVSFGPDSDPLYFPIPVAAELPEDFSHPEMLWSEVQTLRTLLKRDPKSVQEALTRLQTTFDQESDQFLSHAAAWDAAQLQREASGMVQFHIECFRTELAGLQGQRRTVEPVAMSAAAAAPEEFFN